MISINQNKHLRSLQHKKFRDKYSEFVIEGNKIVSDLINNGDLHPENTIAIYATSDWAHKNNNILTDLEERITFADLSEIRKVSVFMTPPEVMVLAKIPKLDFNNDCLQENITLIFDAIRDPGNLGTIIRTADWFGIKNIICSRDSVDAYNGKVVQSSMGALLRMNIHYLDIGEIVNSATKSKIPVYGTSLDGEDFFKSELKSPALVVFGNESTGLGDELLQMFSGKIRIPDYPAGKSGSESLNIASSVAVICSEIRRRSTQ